MDAKYAAEALSTGEGRAGNVRTADGTLDLAMAAPKDMGGSGDGANPEQLFAAGYAACFHSALKGVAGKEKADISGSTVGSSVSIGDNGEDGFQLAVQLEIMIPNLPRDQAKDLADAAHQVCPYSNATRGNIEVSVTVADD